MAQLTYPLEPEPAFPGMLADISPRNDTWSRASEVATSVDYGIVVVGGTDPFKQFALPSAAAELLGITQHSHCNELTDDANTIELEQLANVLHVGRIWVRLETTSAAVAPGDAVFVRVSGAGAGEGLGRLRHDADGGGALAATGIRFVTAGQPGGLVQVEIDAGASIA